MKGDTDTISLWKCSGKIMAKFNYYSVWKVRDEFGDELLERELVFEGRAKDVQEYLGTRAHPAEMLKRGYIIKKQFIIEADPIKGDEYKPPVKFSELDLKESWLEATRHARLYLHHRGYKKACDKIAERLKEECNSNAEMRWKWEQEKKKLWEQI